jgi:glycosyltransferase involved in cell wall biosynthesis
MTKLAVIIPVKNDAARLSRCLQAVAASSGSSHAIEVLVADNGSTDESPGVAARAGARVLVLPHLRVSELRNHAALATKAELLAFIDADHEISLNWISTAISTFSDTGVGAAGALYSSPECGTWVQRMYGRMRGVTRGRHDATWLGSGNLIVRGDAFAEIGGFDASLEACEDVDLCRRLRIAGWRIVADERLSSVHYGDPPTLFALFRAERWRGRDNFRVTLRPPIHFRSVVSLAFSIVVGLLLVSAGASLAISPVTPQALWIAMSAGLLAFMLWSVRAFRILAHSRRLAMSDVWQALAVAATYETARSVALIGRARHHRAN